MLVTLDVTLKSHEFFLRRVWRQLNRTAFNGQLTREPRFEIRPYKTLYGRFVPGMRQDTIRIARAFFENRPGYTLEELLVTLAHESIHLQQYEAGRELAHDKYFWKRSGEIGLW